jgi:hypothetical protein
MPEIALYSNLKMKDHLINKLKHYVFLPISRG